MLLAVPTEASCTLAGESGWPQSHGWAKLGHTRHHSPQERASANLSQPPIPHLNLPFLLPSLPAA